MDQVKAQAAILQIRELMQTITDKCFEKCVTKIGTSLDNSQTKCAGQCMERYMEAHNIVTKTYSTRLMKESGQYQ